MLVDSHCHLDFPDFAEEREDVIARAHAAGVGLMVTISTRVKRFDEVRAIAEAHDSVWCSVGTHPHNAAEELDVSTADLVRLSAHPKVVAIGEAGLDYFYDRSPREAQAEGFRRHIAAARETGLPLVIHSRDADEACFDVLRDWASAVGRYLGPDREIGMMHCFAGDLELAERYMAIGFLISIPGPVTFPGNDRGQLVARSIPLERMLVETDCPYLTPVPWRGRRNEPAYVAETARFIAGLRGIDATEVARHTAQNAARLFGFDLAAIGQPPGFGETA